MYQLYAHIEGVCTHPNIYTMHRVRAGVRRTVRMTSLVGKSYDDVMCNDVMGDDVIGGAACSNCCQTPFSYLPLWDTPKRALQIAP